MTVVVPVSPVKTVWRKNNMYNNIIKCWYVHRQYLPNINSTLLGDSAGFELLLDLRTTAGFCSCFVNNWSNNALPYEYASLDGMRKRFTPSTCICKIRMGIKGTIQPTNPRSKGKEAPFYLQYMPHLPFCKPDLPLLFDHHFGVK